MNILTRLTYKILTVAAMALCWLSPALALAPEHYAEHSALASGRWVRVQVETTGMQFVSNARLKQMGFADPARVNAYGYGGRPLSTTLDARQIDDLPRLLTVHTPAGLCFYGVNNIRWTPANNAHRFSRELNTYSDQSYYLLSDADTPAPAAATYDGRQGTAGAELITTFVDHLLHERDLYSPGQSGSIFLGEDFRANPGQAFSFQMPGRTADPISVSVTFGVKTTNGQCSLSWAANGRSLDMTPSDMFQSVTSSSTFMRHQQSIKQIDDTSDNLRLELSLNASGAVQDARLDHISVTYTRRLRLDSGSLAFNCVLPMRGALAIDGADAQTVIWDVTDPGRPVEVSYELRGSQAVFNPGEGSGLREYVAFNPAKVTLAPSDAGTVACQDIHGMPRPDLVIISPEDYLTDAQRIADMHRRVDGMTVHVLTPQQVYNEFSSATADVTALRKMLKMWYDREPERKLYCLLFGRGSYDNRMVTAAAQSAGYPRLPMWQSSTGLTVNSSYGTDDYIAMLDDDTSEAMMDQAKLRAAVGRIPVKSADEARVAADKLISYVEKPNYGDWRNNVMLIADDQDQGVHLDQSEEAYTNMRSGGNGRHFIYERLYLDSYPLAQTSTGAGYPLARERMFKMIDSGVMYISYIGHANPKSWTHEGLLRYDDIVGFSNKHLPIIYAATCEFANWDQDDVSGAELMFLNPKHGAIAFITASRPVFISQNGGLTAATTLGLFERAADGAGKRLGDVYIDGKNKIEGTDDNKLRFLLMGDPAMRLPSPQLGVRVTEIDGIDPATAENPPVIPARGRVSVKGEVLNPDGTVATDFNGTLIPTLFDAERVIETYGNGSAGKVRIYNDRKNKLYVGRVKVTDGRWETTLLMPADIDNNYSPALLNMYAFATDGREANGSTEDFYVYGWADNLPDDTEGPEIVALGLNSRTAAEGAVVNTTPLLLATVRDESGINISSSGIGHQMTVKLDASTVLDDVADYFQPDEEDAAAGHVAYVLPELAPGDHTLTFTVWDNAGNSTDTTVGFKVALGLRPTIFDIGTDVNPASTSVTFTVTHDQPASPLGYRVEVFDIGGRKLWQGTDNSTGGTDSTLSMTWNLTDGSGARVPRGIYLYRATVTTESGAETTRTRRLAVTAP